MARGGVHRAGALFQRDVVAQHALRRPVVQRVRERDAFEGLALHPGHGVDERPSHRGGHALRQALGHDHGAAVDVVGPVVELGVERDAEVRRDGPRRGGPDQDRDRLAGQRRHPFGQQGRAVRRERELHVDRRRDVIGVLHLGLGQRRPAVDAPVHRLLALVDQALLDEPAQRAHDVGLVAVVHRQVGVVPFAHHAQALELVGHHADEALGVGAAGAADVGARHLALLRAQLAIDAQLDRQAVAVVAGDEGHAEAGHRLRADHQVLQDLVERRAEVDLTVGVRRAVVQDERRRVLAPLLDLRVEVHGLPARDGLRLRGLQVRLHREPGARQVDGVFPLRHGR